MRRGEPLILGVLQLVAPCVIQWTKAYKGMPSHLEHTSSHKVTDLFDERRLQMPCAKQVIYHLFLAYLKLPQYNQLMFNFDHDT